MNLCYDELRKINRRSEISLHRDGEEALDGLETVAVDESAPDARLVEDERAEMVRRAILRLPEPYRVVVILRHYENLKFREIADVLEIPEGTVKSRMAEALTQLQRFLTHTLVEQEPP
jgi:RNA polymerase sigma-70 factor (ECF subfamily)